VEDREIYEKAKKKVEELKDFYAHLLLYLIVNFVLFLINMFTYKGYLWFLWPLLGWGIGILMHALSVLEFPFFFSEEWKKRMIERIVEKEKKKHGKSS